MASCGSLDIRNLPLISFSFIESYLCMHNKASGEKHMSKGYKYYSENYIHQVYVLQSDEENSFAVKGLCFRSQKKNEASYNIRVDIEKEPLCVINASCDCPVGLGEACGHIAGLLYTLANYKMLGLHAIPNDIACTSQPKTWHAPRGEKIGGKEVQNVKVHSYKKGSLENEPRPITSTLYNVVRGDLPKPPSLQQSLSAALPNCMALDILEHDAVVLVQTKLGFHPKGSPLSYQQQLSGHAVINMYDNTAFPPLPCNNVMENNFSTAQLDDDKTTRLNALSVTKEQSIHFEEVTRLQSDTKVWYQTRKNRITASNIGDIARRQKADVSKLIDRLKSTRHVQTQPMKDGLAREPEAAAKYSASKAGKVNIYPCGCVVNIWAPWLAASPDRKVYDPSKGQPYGLLEVKCPESDSVSDIAYLKEENGVVSLKKNHNYFYQVLCQLAVTGLPWCDFFVWCHKDNSMHCETIEFHLYKDMWVKTKDKVDEFFFTHFL